MGCLALFAILGLVAWGYLGNEPLDRLQSGYTRRDFTMGERLLTQPRVVLHYLNLLAFPLPARLNLAHHMVTSKSLFEPITTVLSVAGILGLLGIAICLARRHRILSFCLLWFFLHLMIE